MNRQNTPLLNAVSAVAPKNTAAKIALYPIIIPAGVVAGTADAFIVHPATVLPSALRDTRQLLWRRPISGYVTQMGSLVPRTVATPVVLSGVWLGPSAFDIRPARSRAAALERAASLDAAIVRRDTMGVRRLLSAGGTHVSDTILKRVIDRFPTDTTSLRLAARQLAFSGNDESVEYLVGLLRDATSPREGVLADVLALVRSRAAGEVILDKLLAQPLPDERARVLVQALLRINDADQVNRLMRRIRGGGDSG